jgi:energy-coupling factor transporter ATP-binding protein EcfA2
VTGLLGPSGCGKTTLRRAIVGVQVVAGGTVEVLGLPAGSPALRSRVSRHARERVGGALVALLAIERTAMAPLEAISWVLPLTYAYDRSHARPIRGPQLAARARRARDHRCVPGLVGPWRP